nr:hypothetical protein HUO10_002401 [Paraburkholderia busanensis]
MKWGNLDNIEPSERLLYWVLIFVLGPYFDEPIDRWLKKILKRGGG